MPSKFHISQLKCCELQHWETRLGIESIEREKRKEKKGLIWLLSELIRFQYINVQCSSGIGIDGKNGGDKDSSSNQDRLQVMTCTLRLQQRRRRWEKFQMESCVWSVWWGEGDLHSFHVGIWCVANAVPSQLNGNRHQSVLSVGRKYGIRCGYMILEEFAYVGRVSVFVRYV